ncbi:hypothetical protein SLA2020_095040 [Shorea laevis]
MLDNMVVPLPNGDVDASMLKEAVELINGKFETEASGNVTLETVHKIGQTGVTYISSPTRWTLNWHCKLEGEQNGHNHFQQQHLIFTQMRNIESMVFPQSSRLSNSNLKLVLIMA